MWSASIISCEGVGDMILLMTSKTDSDTVFSFPYELCVLAVHTNWPGILLIWGLRCKSQ